MFCPLLLDFEVVQRIDRVLPKSTGVEHGNMKMVHDAIAYTPMLANASYIKNQ